jgi:hypothetical protein
MMKSIKVYSSSSEYDDLYQIVLEAMGDEDGEGWMTFYEFLKCLKEYVEETKITRPDLVEAEIIDNVQKYGWIIPPSEQDDSWIDDRNFDTRDAVWFCPDQEDLVRWKKDGTKKFTVPKCYTGIMDYAFHMTGLQKVVLPDGLTRIGEGAFYDCHNLTDVTIPYSLHEIDDKAFYKCDKLKALYIPPSVDFIGRDAFTGTSDRFIIVCEKGSYAEDYARRYKFNTRVITPPKVKA